MVLSPTMDTAVLRALPYRVRAFCHVQGSEIIWQFALGLNKSEAAPKNIVDSALVDRVAIDATQGNEIILDSQAACDHYNVFLVQHDPVTEEVVPNESGQSKTKICFRRTYPLGDVHILNPCVS
jgi:hypothetical protein